MRAKPGLRVIYNAFEIIGELSDFIPYGKETYFREIYIYKRRKNRFS